MLVFKNVKPFPFSEKDKQNPMVQMVYEIYLLTSSPDARVEITPWIKCCYNQPYLRPTMSLLHELARGETAVPALGGHVKQAQQLHLHNIQAWKKHDGQKAVHSDHFAKDQPRVFCYVFWLSSVWHRTRPLLDCPHPGSGHVDSLLLHLNGCAEVEIQRYSTYCKRQTMRAKRKATSRALF